jgi:antitoxin MazE
MQVGKWGDGLAVRLPDGVVEALGLKEGDEVDVRVAGAALEIRRAANRAGSLVALRKYRGRLPADFHFDRQAAHERG